MIFDLVKTNDKYEKFPKGFSLFFLGPPPGVLGLTLSNILNNFLITKPILDLKVSLDSRQRPRT